MNEESIVRNVSFKLNEAGIKKEELVGNYIFLLEFLSEIYVLLHYDSLKLSLGDKTETS